MKQELLLKLRKSAEKPLIFPFWSAFLTAFFHLGGMTAAWRHYDVNLPT